MTSYASGLTKKLPSREVAKLYLKEGLAGSAKNCYQSILEIKPNDKDALEGLKNIEGHQDRIGRPKAALPTASRFLSSSTIITSSSGLGSHLYEPHVLRIRFYLVL
jgi:hypothetical protein